MTQRARVAGIPLLPSRFRPTALIVVAACALIVTVLGAHFHGESAAGRLDAAVARHLPGVGSQAGSDLAASADLGSPLPATVLTAVLCYCCLALRRYRGAIMVAVSVPAAAALTEYVLKPLIHRTISGFPSMPSGHETTAFAIVACVVVLLVNPPGRVAPASLRLVLAFCAVAVGGGVALGLVIAHAHYFTDTIAGAAVGTGVALIAALVLDAAGRRAPARASSAAPAQDTRVP
jgi:membrane-associated phospholipid phosphatase